MDKRIDFQELPSGIPLSFLLSFDTQTHVKMAGSLKASLSPEIKLFIKNLDPDPKYTYVLATPLGASEYYGCFPPGHKVLMGDGLEKNIEDVQEGDTVVTHKQRPRKVSKTYTYSHQPQNVKLTFSSYADSIESTPNHPYLVVTREEWDVKFKKHIAGKEGDLSYRRSQLFADLETVWVAAKDLKKGDKVVSIISPDSFLKKQNTPSILEEIPQLCGLYVSEGCTYNRNRNSIFYPDRGMVFVTSSSEADLHDILIGEAEKVGSSCHTVMQTTRGLNKTPLISPNSCRQTITNIEVTHECVKYFGKYSKHKVFSPYVFSFSPKWKKSFLNSYYRGDGCQICSKNSRYNGRLVASSASKNLALGLQRLLWSIGVPASSYKGKQYGELSKGNAIYSINIGKFYATAIGFEEMEGTFSSSMIQVNSEHNLAYIPVRRVELVAYDGPVYNLEVEEDNSFIVNNLLVHNSNSNGDFFSEEALRPKEASAHWGVKTFETTPARIYYKHVNKDPELSVGEVVKAAYNDQMHRAEVVFRVNKEKAPELVNKIERAEEKRAAGETLGEGDSIGISMGCRLVDGDVCSICGNRAKSRLEYCEHLRTQMNHTLSDGRKVVALNPKPLFFDLSIVDNPAAKEAAVLQKVAETLSKGAKDHTIPELRSYYADERPLIRKSKELFKALSSSEPEFSKEDLMKIASYPLVESLSTLGHLGIVLKPSEFQYVSLIKGKLNKMAEQYADNNIVFYPSTISRALPSKPRVEPYFNQKLASSFSAKIKDRSSFEPFVSVRLMSMNKGEQKLASKKTTSNPLLSEIANLYNGYREFLLAIDHSKIARVLEKFPVTLGWVLDSSIPEVKMASFSELETPSKIAQGLQSTVSSLYNLLS